MYSPISSKAAAAGVLVATSLLALPAHAHISMSGALLSRGGDQKSSPCDGARGDGPMYTFAPGTTITLSVDEQIPHPSYFRIAFDNDGEDAFKEPKSIKPIDPARACPYDANDKCGEADYCNMTSATGGPTVLWDNLEPHMAGGLKTYMFTVKLPDVECEKCTIQVLQIMEDVIHGAYCPSDSCMDNSAEDIYHRCIDITLKKGATNSPGVATGAATNKGMDCVATAGPGPTAGTGAAAGSGAGGAAGGATAGAGATAGMSAAGAGGAGPSAGAAAGSGGSAGRASNVAGSASTPIGAAGRASTTAGSGGSAGLGVSQSPTTAAGAAGAATPAAAPATTTDSGCSVTMGTQPSTRSVGWLPLAAAALLMWSRKRNQARKRC